MVLDVRRPVTRTPRRGYQQVGFPHPVPGQIGRKPSANDDRRPRPHRAQRRNLPPGPVLTGNHMRIRMKRGKPGDHLCLEPPATRQPTLNQPRRRQRVARPDRVPLGANRALLGHITALRRHRRNVVPAAHNHDRTNPV